VVWTSAKEWFIDSIPPFCIPEQPVPVLVASTCAFGILLCPERPTIDLITRHDRMELRIHLMTLGSHLRSDAAGRLNTARPSHTAATSALSPGTPLLSTTSDYRHRSGAARHCAHRHRVTPRTKWATLNVRTQRDHQSDYLHGDELERAPETADT